MAYENSENPEVEVQFESTTTDQTPKEEKKFSEKEETTLYTLFHSLFTQIFFPDNNDGTSIPLLLKRTKNSVCRNAPYLRQATKNSTNNLLLWTRQGSPFRALLVISAGTITFLSLTGFLVFMLFFVGATINAVIISLFISLAAAGGFLAIFFACITAVYIGALSVALVVISTATITTVIAVLITTGWLIFFYALWWVAKKTISFAERSLNITSSALSAYSAGRHASHRSADKGSSID
ncbi:hypothetical protein MKW98_031378 [Papaver atlanticum]|uniref:Uncharacterized protein n=1 Tax=Papaver atlanticum TaxID=357466 RepID=A0AAD4S5L3_9MAGN|nr:hypothetical protein MKW98_031378 [Papaver atlanticum]